MTKETVPKSAPCMHAFCWIRIEGMESSHSSVGHWDVIQRRSRHCSASVTKRRISMAELTNGVGPYVTLTPSKGLTVK